MTASHASLARQVWRHVVLLACCRFIHSPPVVVFSTVHAMRLHTMNVPPSSLHTVHSRLALPAADFTHCRRDCVVPHRTPARPAVCCVVLVVCIGWQLSHRPQDLDQGLCSPAGPRVAVLARRHAITNVWCGLRLCTMQRWKRPAWPAHSASQTTTSTRFFSLEHSRGGRLPVSSSGTIDEHGWIWKKALG